MVTVRFFASFRERLNMRQLQVPLPQPECRVADLLSHLIATGGETWAEVLSTENLVIAVNQMVCDREKVIRAGDEVAFYPPVTGG